MADTQATTIQSEQPNQLTNTTDRDNNDNDNNNINSIDNNIQQNTSPTHSTHSNQNGQSPSISTNNNDDITTNNQQATDLNHATTSTTATTTPNTSTKHLLLTFPNNEDTFWYLLDKDNNPNGPYPTSHMREWYKSGYVTQQSRVRPDIDDLEKFYPVQQILPAFCHPAISTPASPTPPATTPPTTAPAPTPPIESEPQTWYYSDMTGQQFGPFAESVMKAWVRAGHLPLVTPVYCSLLSQLGWVYLSQSQLYNSIINNTSSATSSAAAASALSTSAQQQDDKPTTTTTTAATEGAGVNEAATHSHVMIASLAATPFDGWSDSEHNAKCLLPFGYAPQEEEEWVWYFKWSSDSSSATTPSSSSSATSSSAATTTPSSSAATSALSAQPTAIVNTELGPWSTHQMREWYSKGFLTATRLPTTSSSSATTSSAATSTTSTIKHTDQNQTNANINNHDNDAIATATTTATSNNHHVTAMVRGQCETLFYPLSSRVRAFMCDPANVEFMTTNQTSDEAVASQDFDIDYSVSATFNTMAGRLQVGGASGREDRSLRQLQHYFDFNKWQEEKNTKNAKKRRT